MSYSRLLSDEERKRFAWWLEQEAHDGEFMSVNIEKMMNDAPSIMLARKIRAEALAAAMIARKLRETESMTLGG